MSMCACVPVCVCDVRVVHARVLCKCVRVGIVYFLCTGVWRVIEWTWSPCACVCVGESVIRFVRVCRGFVVVHIYSTTTYAGSIQQHEQYECVRDVRVIRRALCVWTRRAHVRRVR